MPFGVFTIMKFNYNFSQIRSIKELEEVVARVGSKAPPRSVLFKLTFRSSQRYHLIAVALTKPKLVRVRVVFDFGSLPYGFATLMELIWQNHLGFFNVLSNHNT